MGICASKKAQVGVNIVVTVCEPCVLAASPLFIPGSLFSPQRHKFSSGSVYPNNAAAITPVRAHTSPHTSRLLCERRTLPGCLVCTNRPPHQRLTAGLLKEMWTASAACKKLMRADSQELLVMK